MNELIEYANLKIKYKPEDTDEIKTKLYNSRSHKRNPIYDDIIDKLYEYYADTEIYYIHGNYNNCINLITDIFNKIISGEIYNLLTYEDYMEDERFIFTDKQGNKTYYMTLVDFNYYREKLLKKNFKITSVYSDFLKLLVKCLIGKKDYVYAKSILVKHLTRWNTIQDYEYLKIWAICEYFTENYLECIKILQYTFNLYLEASENNIINNLTKVSYIIILMSRSFFQLNMLNEAELIITKFIEHYKLNFYDNKKVMIILYEQLIEIKPEAEKKSIREIINIYSITYIS